MIKIELLIDVPREDSAISLKDSYLESEFDLKHEAAGNLFYAVSEHIILVIRVQLKYLLIIG